MRRLRTTAPAALAAAGALLLSGAAFAQDPAPEGPTGPDSAGDRATVILLRAERLAEAGRCDEMLELAASAPERARESAELLRLEGNCLIDLARYEDAIATLERAEAADPELENVALLEAIAYYHLEDYDRAGALLKTARGRTTETAQLDLYTGLVLLQNDQPREAALALERARTADPEAVEPMASYYAALAWHADREADRAHAALSRVRAVDPDGPWARQASRALSTEVGHEPYWVSITGGLEFDSNVRLSPSGNFPDQDDGRAVWSVQGGTRLFERNEWSAGLVGSYTGSAHFDLNEFDTHYPLAGIWVDRRVGEFDLLRLRYDAGFAWVDYDPFLFSQLPRASWYHAWDEAGLTELFVQGEINDYRFDLVSAGLAPGFTADAVDRSGAGIHAGVDHRIPLGFASAVARGGYTYHRYWSDGREWDFDAHRFHLGGSVLLPFEVVLDLEGAYSYRPHESSPTYLEPDGGAPTNDKRRDHVYTIDTSLGKDLTEHWSVSTAYHWIHSDSNSGFFDYDRHVVGAYVTVTLP